MLNLHRPLKTAGFDALLSRTAKYLRAIICFSLLLFVALFFIQADSHTQRRISRIAFGSCLMPERPHTILKTIVGVNPDLFVFTGDNIYADTHNPRVMRRKYRHLAKSRSFQELLQTSPVLATWDDHDYGWNDSGADYPMKIESEEIFENFWNISADSEVRTRPGVYDAQAFGPDGNTVQVILLALQRYFAPRINL